GASTVKQSIFIRSRGFRPLGRWGLALCLALVAGALPVAATERGPLTAETMWELKRLATPALSPDGRHAVVAVTSHDRKKDSASTRLWLIDTRDGQARPLTAEENSSSSPEWSPDGRHILFQSRRGEDTVPQLYVISMDGGEARRITSVPTGAGNARWFPDGRQVAFVSRVWTDLETWEEQEKRQKERKDSK